jgi:hypothetical protein
VGFLILTVIRNKHIASQEVPRNKHIASQEVPRNKHIASQEVPRLFLTKYYSFNLNK